MVFVSNVLTEEMISAGEKLIKHLDQTDLSVKASLWFYDFESNTWRLIIAAPEIRTHGPRMAYSRIQSILHRNPDISQTISLNDISAVEDRDPLIILLRSAIKTGMGVSKIRFSGNAINGVFIENALIYRMT